MQDTSKNIACDEKREEFKAYILKSWQEYQETGLHVTGDEVIAWLETWASENEAEPSQCHR